MSNAVAVGGIPTVITIKFLRQFYRYIRRNIEIRSPFLTDYKVCMRVEAIGENCEVGLMQRHFGAEPLGLLRFSALDISDLIVALREDFVGVGDPAQTRLCVSALNGEYYSIDERYNINSHGLIFSADISPNTAHAAICRRSTFLRRKILQDLKEGSKIFAFKAGEETALSLIFDLSNALRRHGPVTLLCVRPTSDPTLYGKVCWLAEGLIGGYLDRVCAVDGDWNISHAVWIRLLRRAVKLSKRRPAGIAALS